MIFPEISGDNLVTESLNNDETVRRVKERMKTLREIYITHNLKNISEKSSRGKEERLLRYDSEGG